jgi:PAS domain S-box-containing protein
VRARGDDAREDFYDALLDDDAEQLYDRAPCGYLSTAPDGTVVKVNQTFLTLTGYRREELVGRRRFVDLLAPGGRIYHETHYAPMLQMQGTAREIALDLVTADRSRVPVLVNAVLERAADGTPRVIRAAVFDARDRREYERELVRAKERAEESEARARALAQTLQQTLVPPAPPTVPGSTWRRCTGRRGTARRSVATSTTSSSSAPTRGSSRSGTCAARESEPPSSPRSPGTTPACGLRCASTTHRPSSRRSMRCCWLSTPTASARLCCCT